MVFTTDNPLTALYCIPPIDEASNVRAARVAVRRREAPLMPGSPPAGRKTAPPLRREPSDSEEPKLEAVALESDDSLSPKHSRKVSLSYSTTDICFDGTEGSDQAVPIDHFFQKPIKDNFMEEKNDANEWIFTPFKEFSPGKSLYFELAQLESRTVYQFKHQFLSVSVPSAEPKHSIESESSHSLEEPKLHTHPDAPADADHPVSAPPARNLPPIAPRLQLLEISKPLEFMTDRPSDNLPKFFITEACTGKKRSAKENILLSSALTTSSTSRSPSLFAIDIMSGKHVWCLKGNQRKNIQNAKILGVLKGGSIIATVAGKGTYGPYGITTQATELLELSISGHVKRALNIAALNEQLNAVGQRKAIAFGNDVAILPNGNLAVLCQQEGPAPTALSAVLERLTDPQKDESDAVQLIFSQLKTAHSDTKEIPLPLGAEYFEKKKFSVTSDMIVVLDENFRLSWFWSALEHLELNRFREPMGAFSFVDVPTIGTPTALGIGMYSLNHTCVESISYTDDGNFLLSIRNQDWVTKVAYENGRGDGQIIWRLGPEGDFGILTPSEIRSGAKPDFTLGPSSSVWWSHPQQISISPRTHPDEDMEIVMFDTSTKLHELDSHRRPVNLRSGNSRGIVMKIDEHTKVARITNVFDLGFYSEVGGTARRLENGNFFFAGGSVFSSTQSSSARFISSGKPRGGVHPILRGSTVFTEITPAGEVVYAGRLENSSNRMFRLPSLYVGSSILPTKSLGQASHEIFGGLKKLSTKNLIHPLTVTEDHTPPQAIPSGGSVVTAIRIYVDDPEIARVELIEKMRLRLIREKPHPVFYLSETTMLVLLKKPADSSEAELCSNVSIVIAATSNEMVDAIFEEVSKRYTPPNPPTPTADGAYEFRVEALGLIWVVSCRAHPNK
eukprot:gnl/Chilomastix_cuspidata/2493.p1 GENE.gnl/Chilomastix_cuspidata/2493~~gnl/Chilomastix_cuspidata/2493.p1  ORF type:complete len:1028 (-),score=59.48 gnl/Chilomastix_cuspidata/2493:31-2733(-)